jgi:hypothetical protein
MLRSSVTALALCLGLSVASAEPFSITRSDPALDALIALDAKLKLIAGGFGFIDTPVWIAGPGKLLGLLHLPTFGDAEPRKIACASSLAFGGDDAKTLYIAACENIYAIQLKAPGILEGPAR